MKSNEQFLCIIEGLTVLGSRDGESVKFGKTSRGTEYVTFSAGQKVDDPDMKCGFHYNNFRFSGLGDIVKKAKDEHLHAGSYIKVIAHADLSIQVLDRQESKLSKEDENYGSSRFVNGLIFSIVDFSIMQKPAPLMNNSKQHEQDKTEVSAQSTHSDPEKDETPEKKVSSESASERNVESDDEPNVKRINLDEHDVFSPGSSGYKRYY